ncbi:MAG: ParB N-terminal domain-containing protein [Scytonematopsis contorta HA4267-MV1]|jgi:hypothetical protein|nr:ParB N-terminal domain-containing protein [Scytonematopsis contorta HA4267-MV1]
MLTQNPVEQLILLDDIRRDGGTQPRVAIDWRHVKVLEQQMLSGEKLDPVVVFQDSDSSYWLADGYHRWHAHRNLEEDSIACFVYSGSLRDAVLHSVGANADNKPALPRSRKDKQQAIMILLNDPQWSLWSDKEIARHCKVSDKTVAAWRKSIYEVSGNSADTKLSNSDESIYGNSADTKLYNSDESIYGNSLDTKLYKERKARRGGKEYTINTSKIGKKQLSVADTKRVTVKDSHPLFASLSGTIVHYPNPESAIVQLDNGNRELIYLKDLDMDQPFDAYKPQLAPHLKLVTAGLVRINVPSNSRINGRLGRIKSVGPSTVQVWVRDVQRMTMNYYTLNHKQVEIVSIESEPELLEVKKRLERLRQFSLDPFEVSFLDLLDQPVVFTPTELEYLSYVEQRYSKVNN